MFSLSFCTSASLAKIELKVLVWAAWLTENNELLVVITDQVIMLDDAQLSAG